ncbi:MAG: hypothetical protein LC123_15795 [Burkholderiales bacterium]|nr:hypothetical protein [Burkholderiales bacterium]
MSQLPHDDRRTIKAAAVAAGHRHPAGIFRNMLDAQTRERERILREVLQAKGLMPLLMKQRNGVHWTAEDRRDLKVRLNALSQISPYLVAMAVPGSMLMLPVLAWWLDRRRGRRS